MKKENTVIVGLAVLAAVIAAMWLLLAAPALSGNHINMTRGVTPQSVSNYHLHMTVLWICVGIGVLVYTAMFTSIVLHRKSRGHKAAQFSHSTRAEIIWTVIPVLILVGMALPATRALVKMEDVSGSDMTVKVTGFQWRWKYEYPEQHIAFISSLDAASNAARQVNSGIAPTQVDNYLLNVDHPLVLPVGKKIKFLITAADVIHSWWVPALGWKKDAIPGYVNEAWTYIDEPGIYRGQCAELCGRDHGFMPIVVKAVSAEDFEAWTRQQVAAARKQQADSERLWARDELMQHGKTVYDGACATCHQADGRGLKPAFPALAGSKVVTGPAAHEIDVVMNGKAGTAMGAWRQKLSAADIAAAVTYTRNAFGNHAGDVVQPRTIADIQRRSVALRTTP